jgi:FlaA1/EpsC-like NDP-sugar epimerase
VQRDKISLLQQGIHIHGIPVLGTVEQLPRICVDRNIEEIAIAMPSATRQQRRRVVQACEGTKIRFRTVPSITDIASGKLRVSQIRDVDINDLLGREVVQLDLDRIEAFARDKTILVTGAGGSIGAEMCRQICQFRPAFLLLVEQAENPLFYVEGELRRRFPDVRTWPIICDITDRARVDGIFGRYNPQVVIHAAAHKHVPLMELNPGEAIKNNVLGTQVVADTADRHSATHFVMISTDKAVNPASIMGSSKRIAEMYIQDQQDQRLLIPSDSAILASRSVCRSSGNRSRGDPTVTPEIAILHDDPEATTPPGGRWARAAGSLPG